MTKNETAEITFTRNGAYAMSALVPADLDPAGRIVAAVTALGKRDRDALIAGTMRLDSPIPNADVFAWNVAIDLDNAAA